MAKNELTVRTDPGAIAAPGLDSVTVARLIDRDPRLKSAHTKRTYRAAIAAFDEWRAGRAVSRLLVEEYAASLQAQGKAASTINHELAAIRWYARRMAELATERGDLDPEARRSMVEQARRSAEVADVKGQGPQAGRYLTIKERQALLDVCAADPSPAGTRDAAIIALAIATGARRAELAALQLADVQALADDDAQANGGGLRVTIRHGKGDKWRSVDVTDPGACQYVLDWLELRRGDPDPGPLFLAIGKGGAIVREDRQAEGAKARYTIRPGIGTQSLQEMLARRAKEAVVERIGWHDFRRSLATDLIDAGVDLVLVAGILGHASVQTTSKYDRRPDIAKRAALKRAVRLSYSRKG